MTCWTRNRGRAIALVALLTLAAGCQFWRSPDPAPIQPAPPRAAQPAPAPAPVPRSEPDPVATAALDLRIQVAAGLSQVQVTAAAPAIAQSASGPANLAAGSWEIRVESATPAETGHHVIAKSFPPEAHAAAESYAGDWRQRGYSARVLELGRRYATASGEILDNRILYVSLGRFPTEAEANTQRTALQGQSVWAWVRPERVRPGTGTVAVYDAAGRPVYRGAAPVALASNAPIALEPMRTGFMHDRVESRSHTGTLSFEIGPDGQLEVYESLPIDDYLAAVLPAEMPALWPSAALEAQAVAARSEMLAQLGVKHELEGFDYVATELSRAYGGAGKRHPNSDAAVAATHGQVLADSGRITLCVYSANCGGWTESNDTVWASPPDPALRGRADYVPGRSAASPSELGIRAWLGVSPAAFNCGSDRNFSWTKRLSTAEVTEAVNKRYRVGQVREIRLGDRGVSGRLKWVEVIGSAGSARVEKDLTIRLTFGGLNSSVFSVYKDGGTFVFTGKGRGHGVGLCQYGAKGLATQGHPHTAILAHYYPASRLVTLRE